MGGFREKEDFTGRVFGRLTVVKELMPVYYLLESRNEYYRIRMVLTNCSCGFKGNVIRLDNLRYSNIRSCGCLQREVSRTHGMSKSTEYRSYESMLSRCYNENSGNYDRYGAVGIKVCDRWNPSVGGNFENFLEDMGLKPYKSYSLDRINGGDYSPDNCRWASKSKQAFNTKSNYRNTSGRTGVSRVKSSSKYAAYIAFKNKSYYLGTFETFEDAVEAREKAEIEFYGEIRRSDR